MPACGEVNELFINVFLIINSNKMVLPMDWFVNRKFEFYMEFYKFNKKYADVIFMLIKRKKVLTKTAIMCIISIVRS